MRFLRFRMIWKLIGLAAHVANSTSTMPATMYTTGQVTPVITQETIATTKIYDPSLALIMEDLAASQITDDFVTYHRFYSEALSEIQEVFAENSVRIDQIGSFEGSAAIWFSIHPVFPSRYGEYLDTWKNALGTSLTKLSFPLTTETLHTYKINTTVSELESPVLLMDLQHSTALEDSALISMPELDKYISSSEFSGGAFLSTLLENITHQLNLLPEQISLVDVTTIQGKPALAFKMLDMQKGEMEKAMLDWKAAVADPNSSIRKAYPDMATDFPAFYEIATTTTTKPLTSTESETGRTETIDGVNRGDTSSGDGSNKGALVGITMGSVGGLLLIAGAAYAYKKKSTKTKSEPLPPMDTGGEVGGQNMPSLLTPGGRSPHFDGVHVRGAATPTPRVD